MAPSKAAERSKRAVLYVRYSHPSQKDGDSEDRQRRAADKYAKQSGLILDVIVDAGISSTKGEHLTRGQLGAFVRDLTNGIYPRGTVLLVEDLSRFSRQQEWRALYLLGSILDAGGALYDIADGSFYDENADVMSIIGFTIKQSAGHKESADKGRRVSSAWKRKQFEDTKEKIPLTRRTHYGLRVVGKITNERRKTLGCTYEIVEHEAAIVRIIWGYAAEGMSEHTIVRELNSQGIPAPRGGTWAKSTVSRMLREDRYTGAYQPFRGTNKKGQKRIPDGDPIPNFYPRIVDKKTFETARAHMAERATGRVRTHSNGYGNLFTGIGLCTCGCTIMPVDKTSKKYPNKAGKVKYVCKAMKEGHVGEDGKPVHDTYKGVHRDQAERAVLWTIKHKFDFDQILASRGSSAETVATKAAALRVRLEGVQKRHKDMLKGLFGIPEGQTREEMLAMVDEERAEAERLRGLLDETEAELARANAAKLDAGEVLRDVCRLVDVVVGDQGDMADEEHKAARLKLKALLPQVVESVTLDFFEETFELQLKGSPFTHTGSLQPLGDATNLTITLTTSSLT